MVAAGEKDDDSYREGTGPEALGFHNCLQEREGGRRYMRCGKIALFEQSVNPEIILKVRQLMKRSYGNED